MGILKTYIQQLSFDGVEYTQGSVVDLLTTYKIVCEEMPFVLYPKPKELATRNWIGSDGQDVYVPNTITFQKYDIDVTFLYVGTQSSIHQDIKNFICFLYGRNANAVGGRLAIYDEHVKIGRKDVVVSEVGNDIYHVTDNDSDAIARFKVKFTVYDPITEVTPNYSGGTVTGFTIGG